MKSGKTTTGGIRASKRRCGKKLSWRGGNAAETTVVTEENKIDRRTVSKRGNSQKIELRKEKFVIVADETGKKSKKLEIITVIENKANTQYARRNIITKGAVLKAKDGSKEVDIRVTSRPGQDGIVNGILIKDFVSEKEIKAKEKAVKKSKEPQSKKKMNKKPKKAKEKSENSKEEKK